jgi:hypothetical protein
LKVNRNEPTSRRRLPKEAQNVRDQEIWAQKQRGMNPTEIAAEYDLPRSTSRRSLERTEKRHRENDQLRADAASGADEHLLAQLADNGLEAGDSRTAEDIMSLSDLEHFRLRYLPMDHPARTAWAAALATGWRRPKPEPLSDPSESPSWREGTEKVMAKAMGRDTSNPAADTF